jgi:hypothetical protein
MIMEPRLIILENNQTDERVFDTKTSVLNRIGDNSRCSKKGDKDIEKEIP